MTETEAARPPRKPRRLLRRLTLGTAVVLLVALAGAVVFRQTLATRAATAYLQSQGVTVQSLKVTRLTPGSVDVQDIVLGDNREVTAGRVALTPAFDGFAVGVTQLEIDGLRLDLDLTGDGPLLGSLQPLVERLTAGTTETPQSPGTNTATDGGESSFAFFPVTLTNGQVVFATPSGPMTAALDGRLTPDGAGGAAAQASLDLDSDLGRLQADLAAQRGRDGALSLTAQVTDGRLAWQDFAVGAFDGQLAVALTPDAAASLSADLNLEDLAYTPPGEAALELAEGRLTARGQGRDADISLTLSGAEEQLTLSASAQQQPAEEGLRTTLKLQGEVRTAGGLARFLPLPDPEVSSGTLVFQASGDGNLFDDATVPATWRALPPLSEGKEFHLQGDAILADVALADGTREISAHLPLDLKLDPLRLDLTLREDAEVRIEKPSRAVLQSLGVPEDLLPLVASGLSLTLQAAGELPLRLLTAPTWPPGEFSLAAAARAASDQGLRFAADLEGEGRLEETLALAAFRGRIDARAEAQRIVLDGREARGLVLELPLSTSYSADGLNLALSRAGRLRLEQFGAAAPLRLTDPLNFTVGELTLDATADVSGYSYRMTAAEDGADFSVTLAEAATLPIAAGALDLRLAGSFDPADGHDADLEIRLAGLGLPGYAFDAEAAELVVALDRELRPETSRFALGPFTLGGVEPLAAPLRVDGKLLRQGAGYDITATLALTGGQRPAQALADVTARYGDDGRAEIEALSRALVFDPDDFQPVHLSPLLAELKDVRGTLTAQANLALPRGPLQESARITLQDFSFDGPAGAVAGLNLDLTLTSLQPLASAAGQRLTIRSLDAGVPIDAIEVTFALDEVPSPRLTLEDGRFGLAGANWQIEPATLDAEAARNRVVLTTDDLDLAEFFQLIEVEGLSGEGRLKGRIPIEFTPEDVIVDNGRLEAQGPGRLSIRFAALRNALAGGGETVELAIKALEDFQFESLSLTLDKTAENDATLLLSTLGQNPEVLDGQPFQFNINLESNLTSVLDALRQGYSLSDDALNRAWRLRQ